MQIEKSCGDNRKSRDSPKGIRERVLLGVLIAHWRTWQRSRAFGN